MESTYLYPHALKMPGHLHMLFDALECSVKALPVYEQYIKHLRSMQNFLADKSMRARFRAICMPHHPQSSLFEHYGAVHIDWRWEMLTKVSAFSITNKSKNPHTHK